MGKYYRFDPGPIGGKIVGNYARNAQKSNDYDGRIPKEEKPQ
jgi:hypothetical protein